MLISGSIVSAAAILFLGVFAFDAWLHGTARRRQEQIERALPDFLDILAVCVSAGIAFRPALARVAESSEGPCARRCCSSCARSRSARRGATPSRRCASATRATA